MINGINVFLTHMYAYICILSERFNAWCIYVIGRKSDKFFFLKNNKNTKKLNHSLLFRFIDTFNKRLWMAQSSLVLVQNCNLANIRNNGAAFNVKRTSIITNSELEEKVNEWKCVNLGEIKLILAFFFHERLNRIFLKISPKVKSYLKMLSVK